jgi:hypothetical protein
MGTFSTLISGSFIAFTSSRIKIEYLWYFRRLVSLNFSLLRQSPFR